jgi:molybdate transport system substrate-binding protein
MAISAMIAAGARLGLALLLMHTATAGAAEITILCSTGVKTVVAQLAPQFEQATGHKLNVSFDASNLLKDQIDAGKPFDVAILTPALIDALIKQGKVVDGTAVAIARAGVGIAVKVGAPKPDISSVDAFKRALLNAKSIAYTSAGQSGLHFARVIEKLGIADEVKTKAKTIPGGPTGNLVVNGEADLAVQLIP